MRRSTTKAKIDDKFKHEVVNLVAVKVSAVMKPEVVVEIYAEGTNGASDTTGNLTYDGTVVGLHAVVTELANLIHRLPEGDYDIHIVTEDY